MNEVREYVLETTRETAAEAGVREHWLFDPIHQQADIYVLGEDKVYHRAELNEAGQLVSTLLPGFALSTEVLWRDELPGGAELIQLVQAMTAGY